MLPPERHRSRSSGVVWLVVLSLVCASARAQPDQQQSAPTGQAPAAPARASATTASDGSTTRGDQPTQARAPAGSPQPTAGSRALPIAAAVVAGPIVHGVGHWVAGEDRTGLRLFAAEGVGVLATAAGLAGLALTGASEKTALPLSALVATGMGLFTTSLLADLYGVVVPAGGFGEFVLRPALVTEAGLIRVIDPVFDYDVLGYLGGRAYFGRHGLALQATFGLDHANQRLRGIYVHRLIEQDASTYLELEIGAVHHRFAPERFSMSFAEGSIGGRIGLNHVGPSLRGAFVEGAFGVAFGAHRYFDLETESDSMMLVRLGFGFVIGDGGAWTIYYDHRHDGYAAGMKAPGLGSGVLGHVGTELRYYFLPEWGASLYAQSGSAHLLGLSLLFRRKRWE